MVPLRKWPRANVLQHTERNTEFYSNRAQLCIHKSLPKTALADLYNNVLEIEANIRNLDHIMIHFFNKLQPNQTGMKAVK